MKLLSATALFLALVVVMGKPPADETPEEPKHEAENKPDVKNEEIDDEALVARLEALEKRRAEIESLQRELEMQTLSLESAQLALKMLKLSTSKAMVDARHDDIAHQVAFSVALGTDFSDQYTNIAYTDIFYNIGNGWNTDLHAFRAPITGVYAFYASCFAEGGENAKCRITKNNLDLVSAYSTSIGEEACSNQVIVQVNQDDLMAVRLNEGVVHGTYDDKWPSFSGFLLFPN